MLIYRVRATLPTALIYLFICCKYDVDGDVFHDDTNYDAKNDHATIYNNALYINGSKTESILTARAR